MKVILVLFLALTGLAVAEPSSIIKGRVVLPGTQNHSSTTLSLHTALGEELRTFVDSDGSFAFDGVPPGAHLLQAFHLNLLFPEVHLEVNRKGALVRASLSHNRHLVLQTPLVLRPAAEAQYYEKRKPFDVWSFVKSPYGIMILISVFAIVVFPRMKMDPEDYREFQEQLRQGDNSGGAGAGQRQQQAARLRDR